MFRIAIVCYLSYFVAVSKAGVAPFIVPCNLENEECMVSSAQKTLAAIANGLPDLGVEPIETIYVDNVNANNGDLKLNLKNLKLTGLNKCKFLSIRIGNFLITFEMRCPIEATAKYTADGKILFIPVEGEGDFKIKTESIKLNLQAKYSIIDGSDGQKHWHIESVDYTYDPEEKVHIKLENLFNGDEEKAKPVHVILEESWKEIVLKLGEPVLAALVDKSKNIVEELFKAVPANELHIA